MTAQMSLSHAATLSLAVVYFVVPLSPSKVFAFAPRLHSYKSSSHSIVPAFTEVRGTVLFSAAGDTEETEAEAKIRKAREALAEAKKKKEALLAETLSAEEKFRTSLFEKKTQKDAEMDAIIEELFPQSWEFSGLLERMRTKNLCCDTLVQVVERLHNREVTAKGLQHVEPSSENQHTQFHVVEGNKDEAELARVDGLVARLIEASAVLDEEWWDRKKASKDQLVTPLERELWAAGDIASVLDHTIKDLRREHEAQFKETLESWQEAARRKEKNPQKDRFDKMEQWPPEKK